MNKSWIVTEIDALFGADGKLRAMLLNGIVLAITAVVTYLKLSRFATPDEILTWSTFLTGAITTAAVHFIEGHFANANVTVATVMANSSQPVAPIPNAPAPPAAVAPAPQSPTSSDKPSA